MLTRLKAFIAMIVRKFPGLIFWNVAAFTVSALLGSVSVFSLAPVVDLLLKTESASSSIITQRFITAFEKLGIPVTISTFLTVFFLLLVFKNGLQAMSRYVTARTQFAAMRSLINETLTTFFRARWHFFSTGNQGTLLNTFNQEMTRFGNAFAVINRVFADLLRAGFYLVIPVIICWQATLICFITLTLLFLPLQYVAKFGYRFGQQATSTRNRYVDSLQETLAAAKLILGFGSQQKHIAEISRSFYQYRNARLRSQVLQAIMHAVNEPLTMGALLLTLYLTLHFYPVPTSEMLVMYYAFHNLMPLFGLINSGYHTVFNLLPSYDQIARLQNQAEQQLQITGDRPFTHFETAMTLKDVAFAYPDHAPVLSNITVAIPKGQMVAFVGGSGVGKTTLLDLVMGFYEPTQGEITLDGAPLQEYDILSFRQRVGFVPQEIVLFNTSVRENLLWSYEHAMQNDLDNACQLANAYDFIMNLPQGYDTLVGDRGVRLSVGQRQRIALARAVLRKPEFLLLDEATSALDSESERLIQQSIENIAKATTVVVVAHRLSTIKRADHIYVLADGTIAEHGTFDELIRQGRLFKRMVELQQL